jgi:hypothetical protein
MRWPAIALVACSSQPPIDHRPPVGGNACNDIKPHVAELYRAEAQVKEPKRVDEAVADNTAMVLRDCNRAPDRVAGCATSAATVADLEKKCLIPLDDEGTENVERK